MSGLQHLHYENLAGMLIRRDRKLHWRCPDCKKSGESDYVLRRCPLCKNNLNNNKVKP